MVKNHPEKPFERYVDEVVLHGKTEKQAIYLLNEILQRLCNCKLTLNPEKTKIVNLRVTAENKYPEKFDFIGFTIQPDWSKIKGRMLLLPGIFISGKSCISKVQRLRNTQEAEGIG